VHVRYPAGPEFSGGHGHGPRPALEDAADERRLAGVLQVVADDADQPDAERYGRVPPLVDNAGQVVVVQSGQVPDRAGVHRVVVAGEQLPGGHAHGSHPAR